MTRKSDFMKWIDHQVDSDAALKRNVEEYLNEMMIEQELASLRNHGGAFSSVVMRLPSARW